MSLSVAPDGLGYAVKCREIALLVAADRSVFMEFVYDGQKKQVVLQLLAAAEWIGEPAGVTETGAWTVVSVIGNGASWFPLMGFVDVDAVRVGLAVSPSMAVGITDLLVRVGAELRGVVDDRQAS
jgi:hypothetical protein